MGEEILPSAAELKQTKLYDWQRTSPKVTKVPSGKSAMCVRDLAVRVPETIGRSVALVARRSARGRAGRVEEVAQDKAARRRAEEKKAAARQRDWEDAVAFRRDKGVKALSGPLDGWERRDGSVRLRRLHVVLIKPTRGGSRGRKPTLMILIR